MKRCFIKGYVITKLNSILKSQYLANYIITINHDILALADTLKEAKKIIKEL